METTVSREPVSEQRGIVVQQMFVSALRALGADVRQNKNLDDRWKVDFVIDRIPLSRDERKFAVQITTRAGTLPVVKMGIFLSAAGMVADRLVYVSIDPHLDPDEEIAALFLSALRIWPRDRERAAWKALGIAITRNTEFDIFDLSQRISDVRLPVDAARGQTLIGKVTDYDANKRFGFLEGELRPGRPYTFFFHHDECVPEVRARLEAGELKFRVRFTNAGYRNETSITESPLAGSVELYTNGASRPDAPTEPDTGAAAAPVGA